MPKHDTTSFGPAASDLVDHVRSALAGKPEAMLGTAASVMEARARRLATSEARLAEQLGADHPRVADLRRRRSVIEAADVSLRREIESKAEETPLRSGEWLATGRIVDERGAPLTGFRVVVLDEDLGPDDPLGDEVVDDEGEWRAEYHERDFSDEKDVVPNLKVLVFDRSGRQVFETPEAVPANASRRNRFEIALTDRRLEQGVERRLCTATTAAGTPCKNLARPGSEHCRVHDPSAKRGPGPNG